MTQLTSPKPSSETAPSTATKPGTAINPSTGAARNRRRPLIAFLPLLVLIFLCLGSPALSLAGDLVCRMSEKGPAQSITLYNFALTLNRQNIKALCGRAEANKRLGNLQAALKDVDSALDIAKSAQALALKGELLLRAKSAAIVWQEPLQEASQLKESKALGLAYQKRAFQAVYGQAPPREIICLSSVALLLDKDLPRAFAYRANAYNQIGDYHRALIDCRQGMRCPLTKSDRALLYMQRADALYGMGKIEDTVYSARQAVRLRPTESNYTDAVAYMMENGDYEEALALSSKWHEHFKVSPERKLLRKRILQLKGLPTLANDITTIPWEEDIMADYYCQRALSFYRAKNYKAAEKAAKYALSFYKNDETAMAIALCSEANLSSEKKSQ